MFSPSQPHAKFRELLDAHHSWPTEYLFKFIVPEALLTKTQLLFQPAEISYRMSSTGKYVSLSFSLKMESSDGVLAVYEKAKQIPGIIAL